ncbi:hypothetical protein ACFRAO_04755 [Streptomyces sp. NPDC056656]
MTDRFSRAVDQLGGDKLDALTGQKSLVRVVVQLLHTVGETG